MIRGVICDLDGFLVETWKTDPLPGVLDTLAVLRERGIPVAVASNQAGPLWRIATGQEKYPSAEEVASRLLTCASRLGLTDAPWFVATHDDRVLDLLPMTEVADVAESITHSLAVALGALPIWHVSHNPGWRKPFPGMLWAACNVFSLALPEAVYGGDLPSDKEAAANAGVRYIERLPDVLALLESEG